MAVFPIVKGVRARATKITNCGLPVAGAANFLVTDGYVSVKLTPVMNEAKELEQLNAEGRVCVMDRTPPERKHYRVDLELCQVNTGLITMFNGWEQVLDYADKPVGYRDQKAVDDEYGVAVEIWTGGRAEEDCPIPDDDTVFSAAGSGLRYGYLLFGATEWTVGEVNVNANVATLTLSGITIPMPQWGRGPWNVAAIDGSNTAGRLLAPVNDDAHYTFFRTVIAPPEPTTEHAPQPLEVASIFQAPDYYFGGPGNAPAADVAPDQPVPSL